MPTYAMLKLTRESLTRPETVTELNKQVEDRIRREATARWRMDT
jgi:hypothetical protein